MADDAAHRGGRRREYGAASRTARRRHGLLAWFTGKRLAFIGAGLVAAIVLAIVLGSLDDDKNNGGSDGASTTTTVASPRTAPVVVDGATPGPIPAST